MSILITGVFFGGADALFSGCWPGHAGVNQKHGKVLFDAGAGEGLLEHPLLDGEEVWKIIATELAASKILLVGIARAVRFPPGENNRAFNNAITNTSAQA